jgi:hypothetical protein
MPSDIFDKFIASSYFIRVPTSETEGMKRAYGRERADLWPDWVQTLARRARSFRWLQ